jgi:predicted nucleic acid-binding protein
MIVGADSSVLISYLAGQAGPAIEAVAAAVENSDLRLPSVVITELLSHPIKSANAALLIAGAPALPILPGYWVRAGQTRRTLLALGLKARLADTLVAQSCLDADVPLIALDGDFRHFVAYCGLRLA